MSASSSLLTVNVIAYNHKSYIRLCLDSLLSQKTSFPFIIRIFDDCSTDGTTDICRDYASRYPDRIELRLPPRNLGAEQNSFRSYQEIVTPYYMYIEGDDYCCNDYKLERQVAALEEHPDCSFCAHDTLVVDHGDKLLTNTNHSLYGDYGGFPREGVITLEDIKNSPRPMPTHISSRVARSSAIRGKIKYPATICFDGAQFYWLLLRGNMYYIRDAMTCYVQTGTGQFSGEAPHRRIQLYLRAMSMFNEDTDLVLAKHLYREFATYINYILLTGASPEERISYMSFTLPRAPALFTPGFRLKLCAKYLLPPMAVDFLNRIRRLLRAA